jgi:hypothetical protein
VTQRALVSDFLGVGRAAGWESMLSFDSQRTGCGWPTRTWADDETIRICYLRTWADGYPSTSHVGNAGPTPAGITN